MRLFDFLKKKSAAKQAPLNQDIDQLFIEELYSRLLTKNYKIGWSTQYRALILNSEIEISTAIINSSDLDAKIIHLTIAIVHKKYYPNGIIENIVGVGNTISEKIDAALNNFFITIFPVVIEGLSDSHNPDVDFKDHNGILWHPKIGNLATQGQWSLPPDNESLYNLLKEKIKDILHDNKFNWLKIYVARMPNNDIIAECTLNNIAWQDGYIIIYNYAKNWDQAGTFLGLKQFIVVRRCDVHDL
ncbi:DUF6348 family protein [Ohtaekwangia koreensis]|uniref:Uncharacterized protein n=1 Tax=Ohtaekwangia koreensis TaxID=688867 RepID=A0A1T5ING3_9BACT|nr:DUF6348 family protein [Ohtaekwangia koreensis]SKC40701.1 hypothetical protein SAMN05660236_0214 [Ohtaekwangia koreensis]